MTRAAHQYTPDSDASRTPRWRRHVRPTELAALTALLLAAATAFGFSPRLPGGRLKAVEDSVAKHAREIDTLTRLARENIRVSCAVLVSLQPRAIVQPESCATKPSLSPSLP